MESALLALASMLKCQMLQFHSSLAVKLCVLFFNTEEKVLAGDQSAFGSCENLLKFPHLSYSKNGDKQIYLKSFITRK